MRDDEIAFFVAKPDALALYEAVRSQIMARHPDATITVRKTQITFANRYGFAFVSLPHHRVSGRPDVYIIVTFGLGHHVENPRIVQAVEPYPGRWTHHTLVATTADVDNTLTGWLDDAYAFSMLKGRK